VNVNGSRAYPGNLRQKGSKRGAATATAQSAIYRVHYFAPGELGGGTLWLARDGEDADQDPTDWLCEA
jgi:hypothetical protein